MKNLISSILVMFFMAFSMNAQELVMSGFTETMEPDAVMEKVMDANNEACALIKIGLVAKDPVFSGAVKSEYKSGEHWVYVPGGTSEILIKTSNFLPFICKFPNPVQSLFTYRMNVQPAATGGSAPGATAAAPKADKITITIPGTGVSFDMVKIKGGMFEMGATKEQESTESDEKPVHWVKMTEDYYMGETEVTQALWEAVMGQNPSNFKDPTFPVEGVSFRDAQRFINKLNSMTGKNFSLPTEAQWEYAARGGHNSMVYKYSGSDNPDDVAWYDGNSSNTPHPVKSLKPNEVGLYDMSGSVWEMCTDYKQKYPDKTVSDPVADKKSENRVRRGGSFLSDRSELRNAYRRRLPESDADRETGLRLVLK